MATSDGGGENLPKIAMWCFIYTVVVTLIASICFSFVGAPSEDIDAAGAAVSIQKFTGDSSVSYIGWTLDGCYTPGYYNETDIVKGNNVWTSGDEASDGWFIPGETVAGKYVYPNGITSTQKTAAGDTTNRQPYDPMRLSYAQKSNIHLQAQYETVKYKISDTLSISDWLAHPTGSAISTITGAEGYKNLYYWYFSGWRYQFSPVQAIAVDGQVIEEVKLNVIWYSNPDQKYDENIEGGFLIYSEDKDNFVTYTDAISLGEILKTYDAGTGAANKYAFDFQGNTVYMFIKFDQGIETTMSLQQAFSLGYWSVQFASPMVTLSQVSSTGVTNMELTAGDIVKTFASIVTPWNSDLIPSPWSYLLMIFITAPATMVLALITVRVIGSFIP